LQRRDAKLNRHLPRDHLVDVNPSTVTAVRGPTRAPDKPFRPSRRAQTINQRLCLTMPHRLVPMSASQNAAADSIGPVVSTTFSRTGALLTASRLASAETILGASPSSDPTAIDSVTGRSYQRYANRLAPAASTTSATTTTMRSQIGSFTSRFRKNILGRMSGRSNA